MIYRFLLIIVVAAFLNGCASLPPGAEFPKIASSAGVQSKEIRLARPFADTEHENGENSGFHLLPVGVDGFLTRVQMVNTAERTIDLQYYIYHSDETGQLLTDAVLRAADRGVRVRLLIDDGETVAGDERLAALDAHRHIEVRIFNPFVYRGHLRLFRNLEFMFSRSRLDYRMHNKLIIVDNSISLIGGRNIGDEFFQVDPQLQVADDDVFTVGPIVRALSETFDEYWNCPLAIPVRAFAKGKTSDAALAKYRKALNEHRQQVKADGTDYASRVATGEPLAGLISGRLPLVWAHARLVYDSPEKKRVEKGQMVGRLMHRPVADAAAAVQSELLMVTPYLIPGDEGMQLFSALRKRNVRVRVLTNSLESTTALEAQSGYMNYRLPLLQEGVEIHEVRSLLGNARGSGQTTKMTRYGSYSLHAKLFVFDRKRLFIGSMNFDQRSMHLNTEIGLIIDSPELAQQTAARFESMASLPNSYALMLRQHNDGTPPRIVWRTNEDGTIVEYNREPARSSWQKLKAELLTLLPLDDEL